MKRLIIVFPFILISCASLFFKSTEKLEIKDIIFTIDSSNFRLEAGKSYNATIKVVTVDGKVYDNLNLMDFQFEVLEGDATVSVDMYSVRITTSNDYFGIALGNDTLKIEVSTYAINGLTTDVSEWNITENRILSYSGSNGENGNDGYLDYSYSTEYPDYQENGTDGSSGTSGENVIFDIAIYDDSLNDPFIVAYERFSNELYAFRNVPFHIKANGGSGGDGGDGLSIYDDSPENIYPGYGGNGGLGGNGGNIIIYYPSPLNIKDLVIVEAIGGYGGTGGDGGEDYSLILFGIIDALIDWDEGEDGQNGRDGTIQYIPVDSVDSIFIDVIDERFNISNIDISRSYINQ